MKKIITILSILIFSFFSFADEVELKTEATLVSEYTALKGKGLDAYISENYTDIFTAYQAFALEEGSSENTKAYIEARKKIFRQMILFKPKKFISETSGDKTERQLRLPMALFTDNTSKIKGFKKSWIADNLENIEVLWLAYVTAEGGEVDDILMSFFQAYLKESSSTLVYLPFALVADITPLLWINANALIYTDIKLTGFVVEDIALKPYVVLKLAIEADDYDYVSTMPLKGLTDSYLGDYVNYMTKKILELGDKEAYKATKTLESKLLRLNSKNAKPFIKKVQSIQDATYLRVYREKQVQ